MKTSTVFALSLSSFLTACSSFPASESLGNPLGGTWALSKRMCPTGKPTANLEAGNAQLRGGAVVQVVKVEGDRSITEYNALETFHGKSTTCRIITTSRWAVDANEITVTDAKTKEATDGSENCSGESSDSGPRKMIYVRDGNTMTILHRPMPGDPEVKADTKVCSDDIVLHFYRRIR